MYRTKTFRRHHRKRIINNKKRFIKATGSWCYIHEGTLDKGKIHCSCWMCRYETTHMELIQKKKKLQQIELKEFLQDEGE